MFKTGDKVLLSLGNPPEGFNTTFDMRKIIISGRIMIIDKVIQNGLNGQMYYTLVGDTHSWHESMLELFSSAWQSGDQEIEV